MAHEKSIVGDLINFRGLVYSPLNENGVIFLFGRVADDLHMYIEEIKPGFPDCVARRFTGKGWERVLIEFEYLSSNFKQHNHNHQDCDIVVCWEHDWKDCPLEVIELKSEIADMENLPVQKPTDIKNSGFNGTQTLERLFALRHIPTNIQEWYSEIIQALRDWKPEIWTNIGDKLIGIYSPERAFAQVAPSANSLLIRCFSRGESLAHTKVVNAKLAPRWVYFYIRQKSHIVEAINILKESHARHKAAMKANERTSYFSGGMKPMNAGDSLVEEDTSNEQAE